MRLQAGYRHVEVIRGKENSNENCFRSWIEVDHPMISFRGFFLISLKPQAVRRNLPTSSCLYQSSKLSNHHPTEQLQLPPNFLLISKMSSIIGRSAFRASRPLKSAFQSTRPRWQEAPAASSADREAGREALRKGARRDPELYVRLKLLTKVS